MTLRRLFALLLAALALCLPANAGGAARNALASEERIPVLILTGQNGTDWRFTSAHLRELLESSGRFRVEVATVPEGALSDPDYVNRFQLFLVDYVGARWGEYPEANFLAAVKNGAGVVAIGDSVAAFDDWEAYENLIGFKRGEYTYKTNFQEVEVLLDSQKHPICVNLGHAIRRQDQLPVGLELANPKAHTVIATMRGVDGSEPQAAMVIGEYGKGRVFATPLGNVALARNGSRQSQRSTDSEMIFLRMSEWAATGKVSSLQRMAPNTLTAADRAAGWKLLFNGDSGEGWVHDEQPSLPAEGWRVAGGALHVKADAGENGIATEEAYAEFELELEWKVDGEGNGALKFSRGDQAAGDQFQVGAEGALAAGVLRPSGEWNHARVVATYESVEHWFNGVHLMTVYNDPAQWAARMGEGNLARDPELSRLPLANLRMHNSGTAISIRNFKIRRLPLPVTGDVARGPEPLELFNGKDLEGWNWDPESDSRTAPSAFSVSADGLLINAGTPFGHMHVEGEYANFDLDFDWRFNPTNRAAGSGQILLRSSGDDMRFPDGLAIQLGPRDAGGLQRLGAFKMTADRRRYVGDRVNVIRDMENPSGEWNHMHLRLDGGELVVHVNGEVVNAASGLTQRAGRITFVPMGTEFQYRGLVLTPRP